MGSPTGRLSGPGAGTAGHSPRRSSRLVHRGRGHALGSRSTARGIAGDHCVARSLQAERRSYSRRSGTSPAATTCVNTGTGCSTLSTSRQPPLMKRPHPTQQNPPLPFRRLRWTALTTSTGRTSTGTGPRLCHRPQLSRLRTPSLMSLTVTAASASQSTDRCNSADRYHQCLWLSAGRSRHQPSGIHSTYGAASRSSTAHASSRRP